MHLGEYDFRDLLKWKQALNKVLGLSGLVHLDIDERVNRLDVGVVPGTDVTQIEQFLRELEIPRVAVVISETEPTRFANHQSLLHYLRPTKGGLRITGQIWKCTLGFKMYRGPNSVS